MLERIAKSGALVLGALILFIIFVVILFVIEKRGETNASRRHKSRIKKAASQQPPKPLYVVRKTNKAT